ncbi:MAG: hypothetical protein ACYDD1_11800 [Caulobacteraceae bacterium]
MHTLYDTPRKPEPVRPGEGRNSRFLAKVATLTYWIPLLAVDVWIVTSSQISTEGLHRAGDMLFREMLVYLGFWLLVGAIQALLFSRSQRHHGKRGAANQESAKVGNAALNRERIGL